MRSPRFLARLVSSTLLITLAACLPLSLPHAAEAQPQARPPIGDFFDHPEFINVELSPSGKYLAVRLGSKGKRDRLAVVTVADDTVRTVNAFDDADVDHVAWVNDERMVFSASDRSVAQADVEFAPGLYAVNRDGTQFTQLSSRRGTFPVTEKSSNPNLELQPWTTFLLGQYGTRDSEFVNVVIPPVTRTGTIAGLPLYRLDTLTGRATPYERPGVAMDWVLDYKGQPRIVTTVDKDISTIHYRDPATDSWRVLASFASYGTGAEEVFTPLAFGPDGTLYVIARNGKNTSALYTYDFASNKVANQPLIQLDGYDFRGSLIFSKDKLVGVRYKSDTFGTHWFDADLKAVQDQIDARLADTVNLLTVPPRPETPWIMVTAYSDRIPTRTLLYNTATQQLKVVGAGRPAIKPEQMGRQQSVRYAARDGLSIPAWLTVPEGSGKNLPMVVLVRSGLFVRGGDWGWSPTNQFLASRGYAVLEPEFRGSIGFGLKHFTAGWKQLGLAMQDDIADGVRWAIAQGIADPKRVCIVGGGYGGYAALMGLIKDAALYKCGVGWAAMTDPNLIFEASNKFTVTLPDGWEQYGLPQLVGDPVADAVQFKATSPMLRAAEIRQPLLLAYGGADRKVPLAHGAAFYQAVKQTNSQVEFIVYKKEGTAWALPENRIDFWGRVERFLDKNIGANAAAGAAQ